MSATATATDPNLPVLVSDPTKPPAGYRLTGHQAEAIAVRVPRIRDELRRHPHLVAYEYTKGPGRWQVSWFTEGTPQKEMAQVYISDVTGRVTEAWTGFQVAWTMARGYAGAFGRQVNALYVWLPMCLLFVLPFLPLGRRRPDGPRGIRGYLRRPTLWHLDLLVLLSFSISLAFFNHAEIGLSVPLAYPCLLYLLVRMLLLAFGHGRPSAPLRTDRSGPVARRAARVPRRVPDRPQRHKLERDRRRVRRRDRRRQADRGHHLYGGWPHDNAEGDTYGPVNYYAYVPFRALFGWSGSWDDLPAAHAAALAFDLLTLIGLFFLGRMIRGPSLGIVLAYGWAAFPFTLYALASNSNDTLVALLVVSALLVLRWAPARGAVGALAGLTKFAPLALAPLLMRGLDDWSVSRRALRSAVVFSLAFAATALVVMLPVLLDGNFHAFWRDTISYQSNRGSPFSIWGLWGIGAVQRLVQGAAAALAIVVAAFPRRRGLVEVAALGAAVLIALQLGISHWFYLYIPWFFPLVLVALVAAHPVLTGEVVAAEGDAASAGSPEPVPAPAGSTLPASAPLPS